MIKEIRRDSPNFSKMEQSLTKAKTLIDDAKQELKSVTMSLAAVKRGYTLEKRLKQEMEVAQ